MGIFGKAAVRATKLIVGSSKSPEQAWESAIAEFTESHSSRMKSCPKHAFLGLCQAGVIAGIPSGMYGARGDNKNGRYALQAWRLLQSEPKLSADKTALWARLDAPTNENNQMDVVVCLWALVNQQAPGERAHG
jgi:hypothetical protein